MENNKKKNKKHYVDSPKAIPTIDNTMLVYTIFHSFPNNNVE